MTILFSHVSLVLSALVLSLLLNVLMFIVIVARYERKTKINEVKDGNNQNLRF